MSTDDAVDSSDELDELHDRVPPEHHDDLLAESAQRRVRRRQR